MKALSIRQPWTWLIANNYKPVENRNWTHIPSYRGDLLLHASKTFDREGYEWVLENFGSDKRFISSIPEPKDFEKGGFVGKADFYDVVTEFNSRWFFGPLGLLMRNPSPLPFYPYKGRLGLFNVPEKDLTVYRDYL